MDRLPHLSPAAGASPAVAARLGAALRQTLSLAFLGLGLLSCDGGAEAPPTAAKPPSRVDGVAAAPPAKADIAGFCEARPAAGARPKLSLPALDGSLEAPPLTGRWTWVNVWATWCGPCVEEMPRLIGWPDKLKNDGVDVQLVFMSTDLEPAQLAAFAKRNSWAPPTLRMADGSAAPAWVESLNLGLAPVLPLHLFVNPEGEVVCARAGTVQSDAYGTVKALLKGEAG